MIRFAAGGRDVVELRQASVGIVFGAEDVAVAHDPEGALVADELSVGEGGGDERGEVGKRRRELDARDAIVEQGPEDAVWRIEQVAGAGEAVVEGFVELLDEAALAIEDDDADVIDGRCEEVVADDAQIQDALAPIERADAGEWPERFSVEELEPGGGRPDQEQAGGKGSTAGERVGQVGTCIGESGDRAGAKVDAQELAR